jgi:uncharacterized protein (UPF0333 family)
MRKLTALTVVLSLSTAGQAFAGQVHTTHAAPPHATASAPAHATASATARANEKASVKETANYTLFQIRQQAGVAVLSKANSQPQIAASVIQDAKDK